MKSAILRAAAAALTLSAVLTAQSIGPSTTTPPYVLAADGLPPASVMTTSILTAGDSVNGYRLVGVPDGMGVFDAGMSTDMTLVVNHELGSNRGIPRAHGSMGAFISRWDIDPGTLAVTSGRDHNTGPSDVHSYDRMTNMWVAGTFAWERFCSGDLAAPTAFQFGGLGTSARIFLCGEETRPPFATRHGGAWAHILSGPEINQSWELPHHGQAAFENVVACPFPQEKTVVIGCDDSDRQVSPALTNQPSELTVYIGQKRATGNEIEKAGLVGGTLYGVRVNVGGTPVAEESNDFGFGTTSYVGTADFNLFNMGDATTYIGAAQQLTQITNDVTRFQRVEDGAWDPRPGFQNDFYFVTTASSSRNSRLFRMRFNAIAQPELGGTIEILLDGSEGQINLDNLCVDSLGRVILQEDTGSSSRLARLWMYDTTNGKFIEVGIPNPDFFDVNGANFITTNEETSGIIPAFEFLGMGWYLLNMENHAASADPEIAEGGQLLAMYIDPNLGREFAFWMSSPSGAGSAALHHRFGTPNATHFSPLTFSVGNFPNGAFYGIDISFSDLFDQASFGAPFLATLDAEGALDSATYTGLPSGVTLYGTAIDNIISAMPNAASPAFLVIP